MLLRPVNLAIADNNTLFGKTLKNYLSEYTDFHVSVQASDMDDLLKSLKDCIIDILLIDLSMSELSGGDTVKAIRKDHPAIKILVLSFDTDPELISDLLEAGIHGYISKSEEPEELLQAIRSASENRIYRTMLLTEALYFNKQNHVTGPSKSFTVLLNDREKKILQLLWEEKSNKEIAEQLFLGIRSVEKIRQDMKEKIGVKSTVGLLKYALHKKIIGVGSLSPG
jgi:DNA-binding NarL/FixJ family response regulator